MHKLATKEIRRSSQNRGFVALTKGNGGGPSLVFKNECNVNAYHEGKENKKINTTTFLVRFQKSHSHSHPDHYFKYVDFIQKNYATSNEENNYDLQKKIRSKSIIKIKNHH